MPRSVQAMQQRANRCAKRQHKLLMPHPEGLQCTVPRGNITALPRGNITAVPRGNTICLCRIQRTCSALYQEAT
eukprot:1161391-Pelagomonas_calceolata.AAC.5